MWKTFAYSLTRLLAIAWLMAGSVVAADKSVTFLDGNAAGLDFQMQGEYIGKFELPDDGETTFGLQVIALGEGRFHCVAYRGGLPGAGWDGSQKLEADGETDDGKVVFRDDEGTATLADGAVTISGPDGEPLGTLNRIERKSPTLGAAPPEGALVLFDGTGVDQWNGAALSDDGLLVVPKPHAVSKPKFRDYSLHIEFRCPFMPLARSQARGNCGVFFQKRYEIQVLDSFGLEGADNECGALYSLAAPKVNACLPPLSWQTYDADFTAARFDAAGKKLQDAVATVRHNGILVHDKQPMVRPTTGGDDESDEPGPMMLHYHGNPVMFRNIWVVEN